MSEKDVQFLIGRAVTDSAFRQLLFTDPKKAMQGYELTEEEIESIKRIEQEQFEDIAGELDERISRAGFSAQFFSKIPGENVKAPGLLGQLFQPTEGDPTASCTMGCDPHINL